MQISDLIEVGVWADGMGLASLAGLAAHWTICNDRFRPESSPPETPRQI